MSPSPYLEQLQIIRFVNNFVLCPSSCVALPFLFIVSFGKSRSTNYFTYSFFVTVSVEDVVRRDKGVCVLVSRRQDSGEGVWCLYQGTVGWLQM